MKTKKEDELEKDEVRGSDLEISNHPESSRVTPSENSPSGIGGGSAEKEKNPQGADQQLVVSSRKEIIGEFKTITSSAEKPSLDKTSRTDEEIKKQDKEIGKLKQEIKKLIANLKKIEKEFEKE